MWQHPANKHPVPSGWRYWAHWLNHYVFVTAMLYAWWACVLWRL